MAKQKTDEKQRPRWFELNENVEEMIRKSEAEDVKAAILAAFSYLRDREEPADGISARGALKLYGALEPFVERAWNRYMSQSKAGKETASKRWHPDRQT